MRYYCMHCLVWLAFETDRWVDKTLNGVYDYCEYGPDNRHVVGYS